ncbi:DNA polymerase [Cryptosporangium aurantiacum]|uniref:DNA-directed DNA polymerase n=1 Tax=Cryptosporangium aurantiacum TaxID=134849 RepID=A0A1M7RJW1_9ACTN|nr:DNA polymerase [Cryptosporangium aurantiacum]SHN46441.1 DNA polymerase-1 [Cryptosporangium aurantiacum]
MTSTYTRRHGGHTSTIYAPRAGSPLDLSAVRADLANPVLGLDVETRAILDGGPGHFGPDAGVRLVQLASPTTAWVFDPTDDHQYALVADILSNPDRRFVTFTPYDVLAVWSAFGIALGQRVVDAHLLSKLIEPDERSGHKLKGLTARYLDSGLVEAETALQIRAQTLAPVGQRAADAAMQWAWNHLPADDPSYVVYAGMDAIYVRRLLPVLLQLCAPFAHLVAVEQWLAAQAVGITIRGLALDADYTRALLGEIATEHATASAAIRDGLGFPAGSPRFAEWLEGQGVDGPRTDTGRLQVTKETLKALVTAVDAGTLRLDPEATALLRARQRVSATSNAMANLRSFLTHADAAGRVHPAVNTLRARTGRMSITGPALQTLKKTDTRLRHSFRADPGHTLVSCDFKAVEVRVAAALSRDRALWRVIESGVDIHDATAALMFGTPFTPTQRTLSKRATFGTIYGGGVRALAAQTGVPEHVAADVIDRWRSTYPQVIAYGKRISYDPIVVTGSGRRIPADPARSYANSNYSIQSTARDLLVAAVYELVVTHRLDPAALWLFVHDEVILHVRTADAEDVRRLVAQVMTSTYRGVPIEADAEILGTHWGRLDTEVAGVAA